MTEGVPPVKPVRPTRREKALATRERIVRAAIDVFAEAGFVGARMNDIAARAEVAVQTVYFVFHTKAELLSASSTTQCSGLSGCRRNNKRSGPR